MILLYRCWCWVATGQDSFVAVAEHVQVATLAEQDPFVAMGEMTLVASVDELALVASVDDRRGSSFWLRGRLRK